MKTKAMALTLACLSMIGVLTGCKDADRDPLLDEDKETLVAEIHNLEISYNDSLTRILELEEMLRGVQGEEVEKAAVTEFSDGTGRLTLNSVDSIVKLPIPFSYPNSAQFYNTSTVNISDVLNIKPSSNWTINLNGTELNLSHSSSEISGVIKVGSINKLAGETRVKVEELTPHMNTFFESMPPETINYKRVYVNKNWMGMDATTHTFIDESDASIRCGLIGFGDICVTYFFAYKGESDPSKNELILNLLQTMSLYDQEVRIE